MSSQRFYRCAACDRSIVMQGSRLQRVDGLRSRVGQCCYRLKVKDQQRVQEGVKT